MSRDSTESGFLLPTSTPPVNDEALDDLFRVTIAGITGLDVRRVVRRFNPEPATAPQFDGTWASVGVMAFDDDDFVQQGMRADETYRLVQHERLEVMASFYGDKAQQAARMARNGIQIEQNREALAQAGIALMYAEKPVKAPVLINNRWSNRIDVTFVFRRAIVDVYPILSIEGVDGGATTDAGLARSISVTTDT